MSSHVRISLLALVTWVAFAVVAPAAQGAFGIEKFFAANCAGGFEECGAGASEPGVAEAEEEGFRTAAGYPNFGVSDFVVNNLEIEKGVRVPFPESVKNLRVDVAPGVVTNPEAVEYCSKKAFGGKFEEPVKGVRGFTEPACPAGSVIGVNKVETAIEPAPGKFADVKLEGKVYNLVQPNGLGSYFGVAISLKPIFGLNLFSHTFIEGNVEWASDYHDYFEIHGITPGLIESRLVFKGRENEAKEATGFIRNPSVCSEAGPATTTTITAESYGEVKAPPKGYTSPVGTIECEFEGFGPSLVLNPETKLSDLPDGVSVVATVAHPAPPEQDVSDLKAAVATLPEGLTMNPAAAKGLEGCTPEQIGIGTRSAVTCPAHSQIGTVSIEVPTLPAGSLQGPIYLGKPAGKPIEGPPYTIYLDAESARYGVKVRLKGTVEPNLLTGQVTTTFSENPQAPFEKAILHFFGGGSSALANPLACGTAKGSVAFTPFSGTAPVLGEPPFTTEGCSSSPPPFKWTQTISAEPAVAGASSTVSLTLERSDGEQYVSGLRNVLPAGLVGRIPSVTLCGEPAANNGTCTSASQIGTVGVAAGAGSEPFHFPGRVYLTGPYEGAPFGLSIVVAAVAGPFNLGNVIARAKIEVDPFTARVIGSDPKVPTIVGGVPIRQKSISFTLNRQGFELNPTNCGPLSTETTLTSTLGATDVIPPTPFAVEGCEKLAFKPKFAASTSAKVTKLNGTSLEVKFSQPSAEANIASTFTALPKALPSRLTTLQKACLEKTFAANPLGCPPESQVGTATVITPVLSTPMTGPAILVSHGGAAFPDLDLVLEGSGVRVIQVGNTDIKNGITYSKFASVPDVPVSSFTLSLPAGPHSLLTGNTNLCAHKLVMPTTLTAQNGKTFKQNTIISVSGCGVRIVGHKVVGGTAYITVQTFAPGRITGSGPFLSTVSRHLSNATSAATLKVPLSSAGRRRHRPFRSRLRVGFAPSKRGPGSSASVTLTFR